MRLAAGERQSPWFLWRTGTGDPRMFHVEQVSRKFLAEFPTKWRIKPGHCRNLEIRSFCRHADISCFFPTNRYLCSDFGIKIGSLHSHCFDFCASSRSRPPIQRIT